MKTPVARFPLRRTLRQAAAGALAALALSPVLAQNAAAPAGAAAAPADWWNHSSMRDGAPDDKLLNAGELTLSGSSTSGNESGFAWRGNGALRTRLGRFTNEASLAIDRRKTTQLAGGTTQRDYRLFSESLRYDLGGSFYVSGGLLHEVDDLNLIDSRRMVIAGPGMYVIDRGPVRLNVYAALGHFSETYTGLVPQLIPGLTRRSGQMLYLYERLEWQLAPQWAIRQGLRVMRDADASGRYAFSAAAGGYVAAEQVHRVQTVASLELEHALSPAVAAVLGVDSRHNSNPWPDVAKTDTVRRLSLRARF